MITIQKLEELAKEYGQARKAYVDVTSSIDIDHIEQQMADLHKDLARIKYSQALKEYEIQEDKTLPVCTGSWQIGGSSVDGLFGRKVQCTLSSSGELDDSGKVVFNDTICNGKFLQFWDSGKGMTAIVEFEDGVVWAVGLSLFKFLKDEEV